MSHTYASIYNEGHAKLIKKNYELTILMIKIFLANNIIEQYYGKFRSIYKIYLAFNVKSARFFFDKNPIAFFILIKTIVRIYIVR